MKKIPKIRFKGYTEDWEQRKLGDALTSLQNNTLSRAELLDKGGVAKNIHYGDILVKYGEVLDVSREQLPMIADESVLIKYSASFLRNGDVIIADTAEDSTVGKCSELVGLTDDIVISGLHTIPYRPKIKFASGYLGYYLNSNVYHQQLIPLMQGIKVTSISKSAMRNTDIFYPKSVEEQAKIGAYFRSFDHLITLHQRKCEETKKLKKYMLRKMFPQNGANIPEIRFDGFTDAWEQHKFSDFTWASGKHNKENLDLEPYAITNEYGFIPQYEAHNEFGYMKDTDRKAYNIVTPNSFAYNPARINVGSIGYYEGTENVIVSSLYEVFQTANYVDDRFLWHWFKSGEFPKWIERFQEGSVRLYFYYDKLCECQMLMPSVVEQKKIATLLDTLDRLITLHQHELEAYKKMKQYMLRNMFV